MSDTLHLRKTTVTEGDPLIVEIVIADSDNLEQATELLQIRVRAEALSGWPLAAIQRATLLRVRDVIAAEIQAASHRIDQIPR